MPKQNTHYVPNSDNLTPCGPNFFISHYKIILCCLYSDPVMLNGYQFEITDSKSAMIAFFMQKNPHKITFIPTKTLSEVEYSCLMAQNDSLAHVWRLLSEVFGGKHHPSMPKSHPKAMWGGTLSCCQSPFASPTSFLRSNTSVWGLKTHLL